MINNEIKLIKLVRESDNREEAIVTAINIITSFLEQHESSQSPLVDSLQVQA